MWRGTKLDRDEKRKIKKEKRQEREGSYDKE
jgi:hypothetical protein